jgi:hypothetical protein
MPMNGFGPWAVLALCAALLAGCATVSLPRFEGMEDPEVSAAVDRRPAPEAIAVCHGYGCGSTHLVDLSSHWQAIRKLFETGADAASERSAVARAVALFEQAAGRQLGTWQDRPRTPFSRNDPSQLDCVDESVNTTSLLHLLAREGLLQRHVVAEPARRHAFLAFGVHFTAVLVERGSNTGYAFDSWFHANGELPEVVELETWRRGWEPGPARASVVHY